MMKTIGDDLTLVVGDVHVRPKQNLNRASILGRTIAETEPRRVVFIGDFLDFDSLSAWDRDKRKKMEGRRYAHDIHAGQNFLSLMEAECSGVDTEYIFVEGNHEDRLWRYLDSDPTFDPSNGVGIDYIKDLGLQDWTFIPYKEDYNYNGVAFTHVPIMENGRPVSGKYPSQRALDLYDGPVVFGHTHKFSVACVHRKNSPHLVQAVNVGCFFDFIPEYAKGSQTSYWKGLVLLNHYSKARFGINAMPMGYLKKRYK